MTNNNDGSKTEFTADLLSALRDTEQRSWAAVAEVLGLGSPGSARRLYSALVRPHAESVLAGRTPAAVKPVDLTASTLTDLQDQLTGRTIVVERKDGTEDVPVAKVTSLKDGTINFNDGTKTRSVKAAAVVAIK